MDEKRFYVYIMASRKGGALYIGVTSHLVKRVYEHREGLIDGFTKRYHVKRLVYFEAADTAEVAITREKQLKKWKREWKVELVETINKPWDDLSETLVL